MSRAALFSLVVTLAASPAWAQDGPEAEPVASEPMAPAAREVESPKMQLLLQAGVQGMGADAFRYFADDAVMPQYGLRFGYAVDDRLDLVVDASSGLRGRSLRDPTQSPLFQTAYTASALSLGAKADARASDWFYPYVMGALVGHLGHVRLDGDATRRDDTNQVRSTAVSAGATAAAGMELWFGKPGNDLIPVLQLEVGWQGVLNHRHELESLPLGYSGVAFRAGLGVAF